MRASVAAALVAWCVAIASVGSLTAQTKKTIWDGVYTEAQAQRGEATYQKSCTFCHRDDLRGNNDGGPPLRGPDFFVRWRNTTIADMVTQISELMPAPAPGSLARQEYVDILAFLFRFNGIPAGMSELKADDSLQQILFTDKPPQ